MSNFHAIELEVIRRAESMSILDNVTPERYAFGTLRTVVDLCEAIIVAARAFEQLAQKGSMSLRLDQARELAELQYDLRKLQEAS